MLISRPSCSSDQLAVDQRCQQQPPWMWLICRSGSGYWGKYPCSLVHERTWTKIWINTQMEEVPGDGAGQGRAPIFFGAPPSQHFHMFTHPRHSRNLYLWDFMEVSSCRHDLLWTPFFNPCPFSREWRWGWNFQASNHSWVFLGTSLHPGAHPESPH